jgi:hypothetical protein
MRVAAKKTYDALPPPKVVIAVGACAISGGTYLGHPYTILDGLLRTGALLSTATPAERSLGELRGDRDEQPTIASPSSIGRRAVRKQ